MCLLHHKKIDIYANISIFLSQNNKLDAKQSGFRSGHSTETALLSVTEALRIAKADSKSSVLILLDLSAAFDTVNHQILLSTLSSLDITGIPLRWFESYLTGQSFRVAWGGEVSKAHKLVTGVPQGSVLGPLLFSTYTTSLAPIIQAHGFSYHLYADDTQLYLSFLSWNAARSKMAARSDAAATPGPKNCVFMSVSLVSSSSNCLTLLENQKTNTRKHIYDRQSLLDIDNVYKHQLSPATTEKLQGLCLLLKPDPETAASPTDATRTKRRRRRCERGQKRGKRGGIRARLRANPTSPAIPSLCSQTFALWKTNWT